MIPGLDAHFYQLQTWLGGADAKTARSGGGGGGTANDRSAWIDAHSGRVKILEFLVNFNSFFQLFA